MLRYPTPMATKIAWPTAIAKCRDGLHRTQQGFPKLYCHSIRVHHAFRAIFTFPCNLLAKILGHPDVRHAIQRMLGSVNFAAAQEKTSMKNKKYETNLTFPANPHSGNKLQPEKRT